MSSSSVRFQPMVHQEEGINFLIGARSGILAFEQGLGKTYVAIEAFRRIFARDAVQLMVVICPNSLKRNWGIELKKFAPTLSFEIVDGNARARRDILSKSVADVIIINYEAARNEVIALRALFERRRSVLVLDESHYIKNYQSLSSVAAQQLAPFVNYRWLLSGTPVTNSPADIYPQICFAAATQPFGSYASFRARFGDAEKIATIRNALAEKIRPYIFRKTKEECLDLPEKVFVDVVVELPPWQRKIYEAMRDDLSQEVEGMTAEQFRQFIPTALTKLLRLSQVASNPNLILKDEERDAGKIAELDRIIGELIVENDRKVILWSHYVGTIEKLILRYSHYGAAAIYGGIPLDERARIAARFQEDPELKLLIANPAAAGTGLTLTAATYAIYETLSWRYDYYAQSQDRNHRIGQKDSVVYIRLIAEGTVEQAIVEALEKKGQMAASIIGDEFIPSSVAELTPVTFCEMLRIGSFRKID